MKTILIVLAILVVVMDKIYNSLLNEDKIETFKGFGIYYDNPQKVEKNELRSEAGCIFENTDIDKLPNLEKKYTIRTFPIKEYIITEFPYKGKISIFLSIMKIYPALNKFAKQNGFNLKASFYRAFKNFEGISPSAYIQSIS